MLRPTYRVKHIIFHFGFFLLFFTAGYVVLIIGVDGVMLIGGFHSYSSYPSFLALVFPANMMIPLLPFPCLQLWMLLLFNLLASYPLAAFGLVNVTVEHGDPQITYGPKFDVEWKEGWPGVMKSSDSRAAATFTFTGTHIHIPNADWEPLEGGRYLQGAITVGNHVYVISGIGS